MEELQRGTTESHMLQALTRHWKLVVVVFLASTFSALAFSSLKTPMYESRAGVLIKLGKQSIQQNPVGSGMAVSSYMAQWQEAVKSEIEILRNAYLAEKIVDELGPNFDALPPAPPPKTLWERVKAKVAGAIKFLLERFYMLLKKLNFVEGLPARESAIKRLLGGLYVNNVKDTNVLEIVFQSPSPKAAPLVLNHLLRLYLEHHRNVHRTPGAQEFFEKQVELYEDELSLAEDQLEVFRKTNDISILEEQIQILLNAANEFNLRKSYLEMDLTKMLGKYPPDSPLIQNIRDQIHEADMKIQERLTRLHKLNNAYMEYERLERRVDLTKAAYHLYNDKREQQRILDAMDISEISNVSVVQPASTPLQANRIVPFFPNRTLFFLLGAFLGLVLGLSLAVLVDFLDPTFRIRSEAEDSLELPVWSVIPEDRGFRSIAV